MAEPNEKPGGASRQKDKDSGQEDEGLFDLVKEYVNDQIQLARLSAVEFSATASGNLVFALMIIGILIILLLLGAVSLVIWLGSAKYHFLDGIGYCALIFAGIGVFLAIIRKSIIITPIANRIIRNAFKNEQ